MKYFLTLRTGLPNSHQFSPRYVFASLEEAHACTLLSKKADYLIEDELGPVTYCLKDER